MVVRRERRKECQNQRKKPIPGISGTDKNFCDNGKKSTCAGTSSNKFQILDEVEKEFDNPNHVLNTVDGMQARPEMDK